MQKLGFYFHNPRRFVASFVFHLNFLFPDKLYLKIMFWADMGYRLDLNNPQTYSEKLQWIKLYDHNPLYTQLVDKIAVKDYVKAKVGESIIIPTLKIWDSPSEIDLSLLPEQFVLKTNNGGGSNGVIVCKNKSSFNIKEAKQKLNKSLRNSIYRTHREWPYKNVRPKVFAEKFMQDESGYELKDYKFFCFDGEVKALFVATDRYLGEHKVKFDYYDRDFNHLDLRQSHENAENPMTVPPKNYEDMISVAEKLSKGLKHVRVDLYNINGSVYFGEMTFFHYSGLVPFRPNKWDTIWGQWLKL